MEKVAVFGPTGQIGRSIVRALLTNAYEVVQVVRPVSESKARDIDVHPTSKRRLTTVALDPLDATMDELASALDGVEVVVSALNGKALEAQGKIQDAADKAGVRRFYPSEYGMHHIYTDEKGYGVLHPTWNVKSQANFQALHHPAIAAGRMSYTLIGCGDFYNQDRETTWCPWTQRDLPVYTLHIVGDADAPIDFTHIDDLSAFLVATIRNPKASENRVLNFISDRISYNELVALWEKKSGKKVQKVVYPIEAMHRAVRNPEDIPDAVRGQSAFPDDFWMLVKGMQGLGRFWRPPGEIHNSLFPEVQLTTFERYFDYLFGASKP
ncbi:hypothetical protein BDW62DRAFT_216431 [Aspergillus aurantiobrunneus]